MRLLPFIVDVIYATLSLVTIQVMSERFNMYYTDRGGLPSSDHNCLSYTVLDDIIILKDVPFFQHQSIPYCFRPIAEVTNGTENRTNLTTLGNHTKFTVLDFKQLEMMKVHADHLLGWSAPIDLIERYVAYLRDHSHTEYDPHFYNCTSGWFGPMCQYTFNANASFSSIVKRAFEKLSTSSEEISDQSRTCYTHLNCKYVGLNYTCLDWREVCDGKVDCANGGDDERHCFELELNECEENEYRCQNGLCIADEFFRDDKFNPECLDRTDEGVEIYSRLCEFDPSFRCEEHTCKIIGRDRAAFACGNGRCLRGEETCRNSRSNFAHKTDTHSFRNGSCRTAMNCVTKMRYVRDNSTYEEWCRNLNPDAAQRIIERRCAQVFDFPTGFVALGHVRLFYTRNATVPANKHLLPTYICYEQDLCPFLPSTVQLQTSDNRSFTCRYLHELPFERPIQSWLVLVGGVQKYFRRCLSTAMNNTCEQNVTSLFRCPNTTKCISKHRIADGVVDCAGDEDEKYENSCALGDRYRFPCSDPKRCVAPILMGDGVRDCVSQNDEANEVDLEQSAQTSFQNLCNGFTQMRPVLIDGHGETDETNCEHWPCSNGYTRLDGIWNCPNGLDEWLTGPNLTCAPSDHVCLHPISYNLSCLPVNRVNDGQVDCIGGTDERYICRRKHPNRMTIRFLCRNTSDQCEFISDLCNNRSDCPLDDDERFCQSNTQSLCAAAQNGKRSRREDYMCQLDDSKKPAVRYFALYDFPNYPPMAPSAKQLPLQHFDYKLAAAVEATSMFSRLDWPPRWRCNRGLTIRVNDEFRCICPPSLLRRSMRVSKSTCQSHSSIEDRRRDKDHLCSTDHTC